MEWEEVTTGNEMKKQRLFKDHLDGLQLHAGTFRGKPVWYSDDGGKIWWCGTMFSHTTKVKRQELVKMLVSTISDMCGTGVLVMLSYIAKKTDNPDKTGNKRIKIRPGVYKNYPGI